MNSIQVLFDNILVKQDTLILNKGKIISLGDGMSAMCKVGVGMTVLFKLNSGIDIPINGESYKLINEKDCVCLIHEND